MIELALTYDEILDYPCEFDDVDENSIRGYLECLLTTLWDKGEGFSGKRPFGNSGWEYDIYKPLVEMGVVEGDISPYEEGSGCDLNYVDKDSANQLVFELISHIFKKDNA